MSQSRTRVSVLRVATAPRYTCHKRTTRQLHGHVPARRCYGHPLNYQPLSTSPTRDLVAPAVHASQSLTCLDALPAMHHAPTSTHPPTSSTSPTQHLTMGPGTVPSYGQYSYLYMGLTGSTCAYRPYVTSELERGDRSNQTRRPVGN